MMRRQQSQGAGDQASMAGANQVLLANADEAGVRSFTETSALAKAPSGRTIVASATAVKSEISVQVTIQEADQRCESEG